MESRIRASIRVVPESFEGEAPKRPSRERMATAAEGLQRCGFEILRVGRFGVSVEADPAQYLEILGVPVIPGTAIVAKVNPTAPQLAGVVDLLEVTPTAEFF